MKETNITKEIACSIKLYDCHETFCDRQGTCPDCALIRHKIICNRDDQPCDKTYQLLRIIQTEAGIIKPQDSTKNDSSNEIVWKDIILINGNYHNVSCIIDLEGDVSKITFSNNKDDILHTLEEYEITECSYNCSKFFEFASNTFNCNANDIKTYMFDSIEVPEEISTDDLGGYINGVRI